MAEDGWAVGHPRGAVEFQPPAPATRCAGVPRRAEAQNEEAHNLQVNAAPDALPARGQHREDGELACASRRASPLLPVKMEDSSTEEDSTD
jgi:hypothetical protein